MAIVTLTANAAPYNAITAKALTAGHTDGVVYANVRSDETTTLIVYNSSADTAYDLTVKAPSNAINTSALTDIVKEIAFGEVAIVPLETAKYLDVTTGKITLDVENAALKFVLFSVK